MANVHRTLLPAWRAHYIAVMAITMDRIYRGYVHTQRFAAVCMESLWVEEKKVHVSMVTLVASLVPPQGMWFEFVLQYAT